MDKNAKKQIKQLIKDKAEEGTKLRKEIQSLKWKEGCPPTQRDAYGRKVTGKRATKAFRRPETGPQRDSLWWEKRNVGSVTRVWLLLLGLLRGRPYKSIEAKVHPWNVVSAKTLHRWLADVLPSEQMTTYNEAVIRAWLDGAPAPKPPVVEEKAPEPPKPPSQRPSLLQRVAANLELWGFTWLRSST